MSKYQAQILKLATEKGFDPANLTPAQYSKLAIEVRSVPDLLKDGVTAIESRMATTLGLRNVSEEKVADNKRICESNACGFFGLLGAVAVCKDCNCSGKFLEAKWIDKNQSCPRGFWTNLTVEGK